uniref:Uncharacterized protein n=1 Tax=Lotharella oceanica TaxID=641309 RepID=A0A7S2XCM6_9EUKA
MSEQELKEEMFLEVEKLQKEIAEMKAQGESKEETILTSAAKKAGISCNSVSLKQRRALTGHHGKIYALQWSATGRNIVSAAQDGKLIIWSAFFGHKLYVITLTSSWVMTCGFSPDGQHVASGGLDNNCTLYALGDQKTHASGVLRRHDGYLSQCKFFDKDRVLTASGDKTCILWNLQDGNKPAQTFKGHASDVTAVALDPQGSRFVSGSGDCTAKLWDIRTSSAVMTFREHDNKDVNTVDIMPGGNCFITGSEDGITRLFDMRTMKELARYFVEELTPVTALAFSKSGRFFFAGHDSMHCHVWSTVDNSSPVDRLGGHASRVSCIGVEPEEGDALCTGDWGNEWDSKLQVWSA